MNISHWLVMGKYGGYVWSAFGLTFLIFAMNGWRALREKKQIKKIVERKLNQSS